MALLLFQVCLGSFLSHGQARGDAALAGLISWAEICTVLNASLGPAGREQQGSSFSRESPRGQAFELTTEACSPLSFRGLEPPPHLSPHTTWLVNGSKGLSQPAGRRKGGFFLLFFLLLQRRCEAPCSLSGDSAREQAVSRCHENISQIKSSPGRCTLTRQWSRDTAGGLLPPASHRAGQARVSGSVLAHTCPGARRFMFLSLSVTLFNKKHTQLLSFSSLLHFREK